jgi:hypothetical protein
MENMLGIAVGKDNPSYFDIIFSDKAINHYTKIKKFLHDEWKNQDKQKSLLEICGCLDKFSSIIFQINRLYTHQKVLLKNVANFLDNEQKDMMMAINIEEACYDFEALLLHSRSTLDRLTWFITRTNNKSNPNNSFKDFRKVIENNFPDLVKNNLLKILDQCIWLEDFIITKDNLHRSVRDSIAYYSSFNEKTEYCFSIVKMKKNEIIVTDMESYDIKLFQSILNLCYYLTFFVLNILSYYTVNENIELHECSSKWKNLTVGISDYLENIENQHLKSTKITLCKYFNPDGFTLRTDNYKTNLLDKKLSLSKIPSQRRTDKLNEGFYRNYNFVKWIYFDVKTSKLKLIIILLA